MRFRKSQIKLNILLPRASFSPKQRIVGSFMFLSAFIPAVEAYSAENKLESLSDNTAYAELLADDDTHPLKMDPNKVQQENSPHARAEVKKNADWDPKYIESREDERLCQGTNMVWVGRSHKGDENSWTWHMCGQVIQFGKVAKVLNHEWSDSQSETDSKFMCPANEVITGRRRIANKEWEGSPSADENGHTEYRCSQIIDEFGYPMQIVPHANWTFPIKEHEGHDVICKPNSVMVGRNHKGNHNGETEYRCADVY
ncbi:hypothetical protein GA830_01690 [Mesorhizobium sp. NBSH29]|uniref:hypothetical protein n=1 Tax=Mesorhizobium sp. NBSH29 TaxID=2654249 RepID=UPI0018965400|nr:hypothetical protein [Mesorhizobium sp. NBSH29]QPC85593.1 hypothetical protein GA830_01690 [Mesorhizobium sp. NBSH29]